ncbi:MAG: glutamate--tRNA ligase [Acidimicrobiia bacterium]|nr:glutamate--tRNA ligase [Acidimicrobiia bacterium]
METIAADTGRVRVRFSPAPSGSLHVGSARTALFNYLFARRHGGTFILRIEDTDQSRSRDEWARAIEDALGWLGLNYDEGPVFQSQRTEEYRGAADDLLTRGLAYECFCTEADIKARSATSTQPDQTLGYDGFCRDLTPEHRGQAKAAGKTASLRFRTPDTGVSRFTDAIRGEVRVEWSSIPDFVIVRADGNPLFYLANAVDDLAMEITHVIRGEDLIDSTHRVLVLRAAIASTPPPVYAHLPLILGSDRAKLSKRHGAVALEEFRSAGYLPEAVANYLALLGWSPKDGREIMDLDEVVAEFGLDSVTHAAAAFDHDKLDWVNGEWIRRLTLGELEARIRPLADARFGERLNPEIFRAALAVGQERAVTLVELLAQMDFLFAGDEFSISDEAWVKVTGTDQVEAVLTVVVAHLADCEWTIEGVDLRSPLSEAEFKVRKVMPAIYACIEGRPSGLPLFDSLVLLGREVAIERVAAAQERLAGTV